MDVAVFGANGRMGQASCAAVEQAADLTLVARVDAGDDRAAAADADVVIDFTTPTAVLDNLAWCIERGIDVVVGTTGFTEERLDEVRGLLAQAPDVGVVIAANFSIGAVLLMRFVEEAARYFESAEIVELHHPDKVDAPSGTATATARRIAAQRAQHGLGAVPDATADGQFAARGADVDGVRVHGVRLRGLVAHQEVLFGGPGETLTLRHDSFDRASFMPGVLAAVRAVGDRKGLTVGIDDVLGLGASR